MIDELRNPTSRVSKNVAAFVLAGGASTRMGRPKALLTVHGETMVERLVRICRGIAGRVSVLGWPADLTHRDFPRRLGRVPLVLDELPGQGPLGGIYTALKRTETEYNLFVSCDMPYLEAGFLQFLCARALETRSDVTVPKSRERRLNPVCAVYRHRALSAIRASLRAGHLKMTSFYSRVQCQVIPWREIAGAGFPANIFDNMNTLPEYHRAKRFLESLPQE